MSTPLKSVKTIMSFTKTTVERAISEGDTPGAFSKFLDSAGIYDKDGSNSAHDLETRLFTAITNQNILDNETNYEGRHPEHRALQTEHAASTLSNIAKLDSLSLPDNHVSNAMFTAITSEVMHGLDSKVPLLDAMVVLHKHSQVLAVESQPEFKNADNSKIENAALAVTSMRSWGDTMLDADRGMRIAMDSLEGFGTTESGRDRRFYPEETLASLMKNLYNDDYQSVVFDGKQDAFTLQNVVSLTGMTFNISSDIPKAKKEDMFACAKLFSDIKAKISTDEWGSKMKETHPEISDRGVDSIRRDVSKVVETYNSMLTHTLPGFKRFYEQAVDSDSVYAK
ncbi:hypothetical protein LMH73_013120 [Vibrio splendidus]|nr:hypothetical protein [Vibrio splendidus]MCC4880715.1 hypothetical protein [Vibrio splendidus]